MIMGINYPDVFTIMENTKTKSIFVDKKWCGRD